jgi:hypothetical protein
MNFIKDLLIKYFVNSYVKCKLPFLVQQKVLESKRKFPNFIFSAEEQVDLIKVEVEESLEIHFILTPLRDDIIKELEIFILREIEKYGYSKV